MIAYFYCSVNTFLSIVRNKEIYFSDPLKMNDGLELKWYLDKLREQNSDDEESSIFERMKMRSGLDISYDDIVKCLETQGQNSVFVSCFSKGSDILSQWRAYANDGEGVAIAFDLDTLKIGDNILIKEVTYLKEINEKNEESDVEMVADTISTVLREKNISDHEHAIKVFLNELIPELAKYKNPAFEEEQEVRLVYCDNLMFEKIVEEHGAFLKDVNYISLEHDFRVIRSSSITEFVKLRFSPEAIKGICLGPKCAMKENDVKKVLQLYLGKNRVKISKSKASYR